MKLAFSHLHPHCNPSAWHTYLPFPVLLRIMKDIVPDKAFAHTVPAWSLHMETGTRSSAWPDLKSLLGGGFRSRNQDWGPLPLDRILQPRLAAGTWMPAGPEPFHIGCMAAVEHPSHLQAFAFAEMSVPPYTNRPATHHPIAKEAFPGQSAASRSEAEPEPAFGPEKASSGLDKAFGPDKASSGLDKAFGPDKAWSHGMAYGRDRP